MKKFAILILVLTGVFCTSLLSAQVDSKTNEKNQKSENKADTQTSTNPPAVQSSKTGPGTATSDQPKASKNNKATPSGSQTGTMTSSNAASQPKKIFDAEGNLTYTIDQLGYIRNPKNRTLGQYTTNGEYIRKRTVVGKVENGVIRDRYGNEFARIGQSGKVYNAKQILLGTINPDGTILNGSGTKIGSAPGVDKNVAAIVFFFQDSAKTNTGKSSVK
jgi:hypothetical protein